MIKKGLSGQASQLSLSQPFAIHSVLLECIVILFDKAVWAWRDQVRHTEENRASLANPEPDYMGMHEIARHVIHSSEMLDTAITVLNEMLDEQSIFSSENELPKQALLETKQTSKAFRHHISTLKFIHKRSRALEKRLNNEINLVCRADVACLTTLTFISRLSTSLHIPIVIHLSVLQKQHKSTVPP